MNIILMGDYFYVSIPDTRFNSCEDNTTFNMLLNISNYLIVYYGNLLNLTYWGNYSAKVMS